MDPELLEILVCPLCKSSVKYDPEKQELVCVPDRLAYPVRDGIPIMWADQARELEDDELC